MPKKTKAADIRRRLCNDLLTLSDILARHTPTVVLNAEVLKSSANQCLLDRGSRWEYQVAGLELLVKTPQKMLPKTRGKTLNLKIDLDIAGHCDDSVDDHFTKLILKVRIENHDGSNMCSWHFDRHIAEDHDKSTEAHPLYHFQHGGHEMKELEESLGKVLLLPAPRVASPPMEAILYIDFLLSNFAGEEWQVLRNESTYLRLLQETQFRIWKPYVEKISAWWDRGNRECAETLRLWPHLA